MIPPHSTSSPASAMEVVAVEVFETMLGLELTTTGPLAYLDEKLDEGEPLWTHGKIDIVGESLHELRITTSNSLAVDIGCSMFAMSKDELAEAEMVDAFGEMVNVIAGNLRPKINGAQSLGIPSVSIVPWFGLLAGNDISFKCNDEPMGISLKRIWSPQRRTR